LKNKELNRQRNHEDKRQQEMDKLSKELAAENEFKERSLAELKKDMDYNKF
jgi:hypothetical protein